MESRDGVQPFGCPRYAEGPSNFVQHYGSQSFRGPGYASGPANYYGSQIIDGRPPQAVCNTCGVNANDLYNRIKKEYDDLYKGVFEHFQKMIIELKSDVAILAERKLEGD